MTSSYSASQCVKITDMSHPLCLTPLNSFGKSWYERAQYLTDLPWSCLTGWLVVREVTQEHVPWCTCGSQRMAFRVNSRLPQWIPGTKFRPSGLCSLKLVSHDRLSSLLEVCSNHLCSVKFHALCLSRNLSILFKSRGLGLSLVFSQDGRGRGGEES